MERKSIVIDIPDGMCIDESNSTFERIVFKKKYTYPKSWEEFCENCQTTDKEYYIDWDSQVVDSCIKNKDYDKDRNFCKTKEEAEAFLALIQLKRLWHEYTYNWSENLESVWSIGYTPNSGFLLFNTYFNNSSMFFFPNKKLAKEFLNNFKDLFDKTGILWK